MSDTNALLDLTAEQQELYPIVARLMRYRRHCYTAHGWTEKEWKWDVVGRHRKAFPDCLDLNKEGE